MLGQDPWTEDDYVTPTYNNVTQLKKEISFGRGNLLQTTLLDTIITAELSNPEPTASNTEPNTTDINEQDDSSYENSESSSEEMMMVDLPLDAITFEGEET